ncbi:MAG: DEAD/DEAH box helicase [Magnetococcales bacterium]|nr:DEAD/DEAH box helicase [Magnetococcales bacterium]
MIGLRPYQIQAVDRLRSTIRAGHRRIVLVAPTGAGKTIIASHIIHSAVARGTMVLFLAHRRELINQASSKLDDVGIDHGVVMADHPRDRPELPVQVASVQTLVRRLEGNSGLPELIIIDEAHRATAASYRNILHRFPRATVLGLTATPERSDGRGLGELFEEIIEVASTAELTEMGFLVPARIHAPSIPDLAKLKITQGDYDKGQAFAVMDRAVIVGEIVEHWLHLAKGRTTVAFAVNVEHSKHIRDSFLAEGVHAEHLDGTTPETERDAILNRLATGETLIVANCGILTEGWDLPRTSCAVLARPTKSTGLYLQMVGRVLRTDPGKGDAIILDHAGCVHEHGFPTDPREWSFEGKKRQKEKNEAKLKICPGCFFAFSPGRKVCPQCGWQPALHPVRGVVQTGGHLVQFEYNVPALNSNRVNVVKDLAAFAKAKGYKEGWVWHKLKDQYGRQIANSLMREVRTNQKIIRA